MQSNRRPRVLFVASEVHPFARTGGLADVASSLPKALSRMGYEIAVSLPFYGRESFPSGLTVERLVDVDVVMGEETRRGSIYLSRLDGQIPVLLVSQEAYFDRKGLYGDESGDYPDNAERFAFFCRAILSGVKRLGWKPGIVHCNDWQTALIPLYLKTLYSDDHFLGETGSLFTIHNLAYQGIFHRKSLQAVGLKDGSSVSDALEFYGNLNTMKAGLVYADLLSTVSPTYCTEIQTAEYGCGLDGLIRERTNDLYGILNGVDQELWNPECDRDLARNYSAGNPQGKGENKRALQKQNGLSLADVPLVAVVSRLDHQKGLDLITEVIDEMMRLPLQFVFTGKGDVRYEEMFKQIGERFPGKAKIHFSFDVPTAKRVYAGSDILLMPSRYEPCGLAQMKGMRYGGKTDRRLG